MSIFFTFFVSIQGGFQLFCGTQAQSEEKYYSGTLGTFYRILPRHFRHFLPMHFRHYLHMQFSLQNCEHKNNIIIQLGIIETHASWSWSKTVLIIQKVGIVFYIIIFTQALQAQYFLSQALPDVPLLLKPPLPKFFFRITIFVYYL